MSAGAEIGLDRTGRLRVAMQSLSKDSPASILTDMKKQLDNKLGCCS
jgi:hypothetical protein